MSTDNQVLVIYGRNTAARDALTAFLESLELEPRCWSAVVDEMPKGAPNIQEVLLEAFHGTKAFLVLLTGDEEARLCGHLDEGHEDDEGENAATRFQPRLNVVYEAGIAEATNPDQVIYVKLGLVDTFSDLDGRTLLQMNDREESRSGLIKALISVGCDVRKDGDAWKTAGEFDAAVSLSYPGKVSHLRNLLWPLALLLVPPIVLAVVSLVMNVEPMGSTASTVGDSRSSDEINDWVPIISNLHVILVIGVLWATLTRLGKPNLAGPKGQLVAPAYRQFMFGWRFVWISWLILFLWLSMAWSEPASLTGIADHGRNAFGDILNGLTGLPFYYLFLVLDRPSISTGRNPHATREFKNSLLVYSAIGCAVSLFAVAEHFGFDDAYFNLEARGLKGVGSGLIALNVAVAMAYFFGRLDSKRLQVDRWMLGPLYVYVALQMSWTLFRHDPTGNIIAIHFGIVLFLKCYMFLAITYWMHHQHRLRDYLAAVVRR